MNCVDFRTMSVREFDKTNHKESSDLICESLVELASIVVKKSMLPYSGLFDEIPKKASSVDEDSVIRIRAGSEIVQYWRDGLELTVCGIEVPCCIEYSNDLPENMAVVEFGNERGKLTIIKQNTT